MDRAPTRHKSPARALAMALEAEHTRLSADSRQRAEAASWGWVAQSDSEAWCLIEGDSKKVRLWRPPRRCAVHLDPMGTADHLGDSFAAEAAARSLR